MLERYIQAGVLKDLAQKMVFISGPRQCGKTTFAKKVLTLSKASGLYLNWDDPSDRLRINRRQWDDNDRLIILDEIHKNKKWKNFLKGTFDTQKELHSFLVTGSAKLNIYRKGQDSLMGRYHSWRMHPLSLDEYPTKMKADEAFSRLIRLGGFPEPFLDADENEARRWRRTRRENIFRSDILNLQNVSDLTKLELCFDLLRSRVGSPVSYQSLHEDLDVSSPTVKAWIGLLEQAYALFIVRPYAKLPRAIKKAPKIYFYDNGDVEGNEGIVFENLVANHLLKRIQFYEDATGYAYELNYIRDKEGHEVDFLILKERKPFELIEVKWSDTQASSSLSYFAEKLGVERASVVVAQPSKGLWKKGRLQAISIHDQFKNGSLSWGFK